ncbi:MAG: sugar phosphate nucleotidyltransferase [Haloquadratum sp.]|jgi:glucose-1-phosphate thymidylyltransferase|nr:sugar phosphate nucleotidyltransferase [Haloferacaceae archaeon]MDR9445112.1 sugar phosphate nucleotidyltransferase [Haloquadratum sp.]
MHAVILAAGAGRRLWPLTAYRPKPMLPVAARPILAHVIETATAAGVDTITLVVGYKADRIREYVGDGTRFDVPVTYVDQEHQLGTAHAVAQAAGTVEDAFLVLNGDQIVDAAAIAAVIDSTAEQTPVMAVTSVDDPVAYGVVAVEDGFVTAIDEKPTQTTSGLINAGIYGFDPSIFTVIEELSPDVAGELSLVAAIERCITDAGVAAVVTDGRWVDVTAPGDLLTVGATLHREPAIDETASVAPTAVIGPGVTVAADVRVGPHAVLSGDVDVGANVTIGPQVSIEDSVIMPDSHIEAAATVATSVIGQNVRIGRATVMEGRGGRGVDGVDPVVVVGDHSRIGPAALLEAPAAVGVDCDVAAGAHLRDTVADATRVVSR